MNADIKALYDAYLLAATDPVAAAVLVLADVLSTPIPDPIIIEPADDDTLSVKEAAEILHTSSKDIYLMCLAGKLHCVRSDGRVRIPYAEIERFQAESTP